MATVVPRRRNTTAMAFQQAMSNLMRGGLALAQLRQEKEQSQAELAFAKEQAAANRGLSERRLGLQEKELQQRGEMAEAERTFTREQQEAQFGQEQQLLKQKAEVDQRQTRDLASINMARQLIEGAIQNDKAELIPKIIGELDSEDGLAGLDAQELSEIGKENPMDLASELIRAEVEQAKKMKDARIERIEAAGLSGEQEAQATKEVIDGYTGHLEELVEKQQQYRERTIEGVTEAEAKGKAKGMIEGQVAAMEDMSPGTLERFQAEPEEGKDRTVKVRNEGTTAEVAYIWNEDGSLHTTSPPTVESFEEILADKFEEDDPLVETEWINTSYSELTEEGKRDHVRKQGKIMRPDVYSGPAGDVKRKMIASIKAGNIPLAAFEITEEAKEGFKEIPDAAQTGWVNKSKGYLRQGGLTGDKQKVMKFAVKLWELDNAK